MVQAFLDLANHGNRGVDQQQQTHTCKQTALNVIDETHELIGKFRTFLPKRSEHVPQSRFHIGAVKAETRAYSMANYAEEGDIIMLVVRIAIPPPGMPESVPPGIV